MGIWKVLSGKPATGSSAPSLPPSNTSEKAQCEIQQQNCYFTSATWDHLWWGIKVQNGNLPAEVSHFHFHPYFGGPTKKMCCCVSLAECLGAGVKAQNAG